MTAETMAAESTAAAEAGASATTGAAQCAWRRWARSGRKCQWRRGATAASRDGEAAGTQAGPGPMEATACARRQSTTVEAAAETAAVTRDEAATAAVTRDETAAAAAETRRVHVCDRSYLGAMPVVLET